MTAPTLIPCRICVEKGVEPELCRPVVPHHLTNRIGKVFITCPHCKTCCSVGEDRDHAIENWGVERNRARRRWFSLDTLLGPARRSR